MPMVLWASLVLNCIDKGISLDELSLEEYKELSVLYLKRIFMKPSA